jgi:hypothetical protein
VQPRRYSSYSRQAQMIAGASPTAAIEARLRSA